MGIEVLLVAATDRELDGVETQGNPWLAKAVLGVGKVLSAVNAVHAIMQYQPKLVIMVGFAGAVDPTLSIGDCVIAKSVVQYDVDLRTFKLARGETFRGMGRQTVGQLDVYCPKLAEVKPVTMGSADRFVLRSWREENPWIIEEMGIGCVDMESYAVAYACHTLDVPCTVLRIISDDALGHRPKDFKKFVSEANELVSEKISQLLASPREKSPINL